MRRLFPFALSATLAATLSLLAFSPASAANDKLYHERNSGNSGGALPSLAPLIKQIKPAVVNVSTTQRVRHRMSPEEYFFGGGGFFGGVPGLPQRELERQSLGSGFIIDERGYVLTNNHVIEGADKIKVTLADGRQLEAKVVGADPSTDVALLKIQSTDANFPYVPLGDSDALQIGDWVVAIGNPFGLELSVTHGLVSAKDRVLPHDPRDGDSRRSYDDFIQSDALINPGNSGGPLFNLSGDVVGINTAITSTGQGIGFAVPINMAKQLIPQLESGKIVRGWLGVSIQPLNPNLAQALNTTKGAVVAQLVRGGPAAKAGLHNGDVVVALNGKTVGSPSELTRYVGSLTPGTKADIDVIRDGKPKTLKIRIGERPGDDRLGSEPLEEGGEAAPERRAESKPDALGLAVTSLNPEQSEALGLNGGEGVIVTQVRDDGPAAQAGVERGDVVVEVNRRAVHSVGEYEQAVKAVRPGEMALLRLQRQAASIYVAVKI